jgi:hypothetical protein
LLSLNVQTLLALISYNQRELAIHKKELWRINIKQAIQGLFTTGTSEKKEKVGGKRGLKPLSSKMGGVQGCPNNPAGYKLYKQ